MHKILTTIIAIAVATVIMSGRADAAAQQDSQLEDTLVQLMEFDIYVPPAAARAAAVEALHRATGEMPRKTYLEECLMTLGVIAIAGEKPYNLPAWRFDPMGLLSRESRQRAIQLGLDRIDVIRFRRVVDAFERLRPEAPRLSQTLRARRSKLARDIAPIGEIRLPPQARPWPRFYSEADIKRAEILSRVLSDPGRNGEESLADVFRAVKQGVGHVAVELWTSVDEDDSSAVKLQRFILACAEAAP